MLSELLSLGGSLLSGALNNNSAMDRQEQAQGFSAQQFASRYQTTVKDMQAAGLNPMLAYSQGGGSAPTSSAASSAGYADMGQNFNASRIASAQTELIKAQAEAASAQAAKTKAETFYVGPSAEAEIGYKGASADQARASIFQINATVDKIKQETDNLSLESDNIVKQGKVLWATVKNLESQSVLALQRGMTEVQSRDMMKATIGKLMSETSLNKLDIDAALKFENFGREAKQYAPIIDLLKEVMRHRR